MRHAGWRVSAHLLGAIALAGCAGMQPIDLRYAPAGAAAEIPRGRMPKILLANVVDRSGGLRNNNIARLHPGSFARPLDEAFKAALVEELRRLHAPLVQSRLNAEALLEASITGAEVGWNQGMQIPVQAALMYTLKLKSLSGATLWETDLMGAGTAIAPGSAMPGNAPNQAMNAALADAMGKLGPALAGEDLYSLAHAKGAAPSAAGGGVSKAELQAMLQEAVKGAPKPEEPADSFTSDVDGPTYRLKERPSDFALVIGVAKYKDIPEAQFAGRDAAAVRDHLLASGYPRRNVIFLQDDSATRSGLQKYLEEWLPRNVGSGSTVFFYFSGHGAPDPKTGAAYLVPWDGDPQFLQTTAYPLAQLYDSLSRLKAKQVLVALDACFSGAGGRSVLAKGARPLVIRVETGLVRDDRLVVFSAASGEEITGTLEDQGHGIFTYHFLKGLSGAAKDAKGTVTAGRLYEYLKPRVEDDARRQNREQSPGLTGTPEQVLVHFE
jgi:hypothetical protein